MKLPGIFDAMRHRFGFALLSGLLFPIAAIGAEEKPILLLHPVEWEVAGEEVWPAAAVIPPASVLRLALESEGHPVLFAPRSACFSEACAHKAAQKRGVSLVLASAIIREDSTLTAKLALYDTVTHEVRAARVTWVEGAASERLEKLRAAAADLVSGRGSIEGGPFASIPWLRVSPDPQSGAVARWAAPALGAAILATAWLEGHFSGDKTALSPSQALTDGDRAMSFLPGFFSGFTPPTSMAARGGSGMALAVGAEACLISPAGIAPVRHTELLLLRSSLPDGTPEFQAALAAPAGPGFAQGYSLRYRGDGLADEAVLGATWAADFGWLHPALIGMQAGVTAKLLLAQVGAGGVGEERSRGRSFGAGLDIGLRARLMRGVYAAATLEDAASYLHHRNDFTNLSGSEIRPPRLTLGASLRPSETLWLTVDGRKGLYADQGDAVAVGLEKSVLSVLRLRSGLQEIFGRETLRKVAAGFGLRNDGFENLFGGRRLAVDYAFEYGLDEAGILAGGHRFGLLASF